MDVFRSGGCVASYPGCVGGEKHFTPPMQPGTRLVGVVKSDGLALVLFMTVLFKLEL